MHIGIVLDELWPMVGGIATYYGMLARLFTEAGHQTTIFLDEGTHAPCEFDRLGAKIIFMRQATKHWEDELDEFFPEETSLTKRDLALGLAVGDWFLEKGPAHGIDVLETADTKGYGVTLLDFDLPPLVVACHGSVSLRFRHEGLSPRPFQLLRGSFEMMLLGLADEIVAASPMNIEEWQAVLGREVKRVTAPWRPLDSAVDSRERGRTANDRLRGVVLARLSMQKGPLEMALACRKLAQSGQPVEIRWFGRSLATGPQQSDMSTYMRGQFGDVWGTTFDWRGEQPRNIVLSELSQADFLLAPSLWEPLNYTVLEAFDAGIPVIVSDGAGAAYLCQDGVNALVVPAGDADALAQAIKRMRDPAMRTALAQAGRETLAREFTAEKIVGSRIAAYESAIERREQRRKYLGFFSPARPLVAHAQRLLETLEYDTVERMSWPRLMRRLMGKTRRQVTQSIGGAKHG